MALGDTGEWVQTITFALKKPEICLGNKIHTKIKFIPECALGHL